MCVRGGGGNLQLGPLVFKSAGSIYLGNNPFNHDRGRGINTQNTIFFFIIFHLLHQRLVASRLVSRSALFVFLIFTWSFCFSEYGLCSDYVYRCPLH